ncbi:cobalamin-dependent protein [Dysgonomonas sp. GY75]|uniref:B12-binding domain-containing radical SAM protein n=1 Tax=Dysgonomonas sp. GY75 TaxID=2780419 RepID=UPI001883A2DA|nr:radical SAM protein [Dysgonomonas sp. GY75]MBF0651490.1 cobalamin-dependent protein [Dysgonomonas sp. GY75]
MISKKKLNILLVIPRYETYGDRGHYVMPLGILYVSSYLKHSQKANVLTINLNHKEGDEEDILSTIIHQSDIDIFAIGGLSGEYIDISRMVNLARRIKPSIKIIVGGGIMTADPEVTMQALPEVDYGVIGEGEITIVELVNALTKNQSVSYIKGVIFKEEGKLVRTPQRKEIVNLDELPFPDYEGFDYGTYLNENPDISDDGIKYSQVSVIGGRSCKYNCTFCFHPSGTTYRQRSLDSIFLEIDYLVSHYSISYIALREELFATDNKRVEDFCKRIEPYDFIWSIQLRIDSINQELVNLLKNTKCRYVFVGVESASNEVLRSMRKGINLAQIEKALNMLNEANLNSRSGVIFGDSAETFDTAIFSLEWFKKNRSCYRMFVDMIIAFPGSALYKRACQNGVISDPVQFLKDGCPIVNVSKMNTSEFLQLVRLIEDINQRHYKIADYSELEVVKSLH